MCSLIHPHNQGKFEDNKGVIRCHKSKNDRQYNVQIKITKGVIRRRKSQNDRQYNVQIKRTKGVIRRRKSQNDRQYNVQIKRTKGQTTIYKTGKTKHRATPIPLSTGVDLCCFG